MENSRYKFRAWDKDRKVMANVSNIDFLTGQVQMNAGGMHSERVSGDKVILLRYTGLKDKNGVEIYERDIVQYFRNELAVIVFQNGGVDIRGLSSMEREPLQSRMGFMKVLGNIYENPELLERETE